MIELDIRKALRGPQGDLVLGPSVRVGAGEFVTLFGESGAGKTTLLRCLAGLATPDSGIVRVNGEIWFDSQRKINLSPQQRRVGFMFQDYALFPNMTVRGNLEFALRKGASRSRIGELIDLMALGDLQHRRPATLSGGQQQRVALARALASEPKLLLLDEPFSALDHPTRLRLQDEVLHIQKRFNVTIVMVSHDVSEVYKLAQRVLVMDQGRILREGSPAAVFGSGQAGGRFRFAGEVLAIEQADVVFAVILLVGNQVMRVIATTDEAQRIKVGDRVTLLSKAFNPVLAPVSVLP